MWQKLIQTDRGKDMDRILKKLDIFKKLDSSQVVFFTLNWIVVMTEWKLILLHHFYVTRI